MTSERDERSAQVRVPGQEGTQGGWPGSRAAGCLASRTRAGASPPTLSRRAGLLSDRPRPHGAFFLGRRGRWDPTSFFYRAPSLFFPLGFHAFKHQRSRVLSNGTPIAPSFAHPHTSFAHALQASLLCLSLSTMAARLFRKVGCRPSLPASQTDGGATGGCDDRLTIIMILIATIMSTAVILMILVIIM